MNVPVATAPKKYKEDGNAWGVFRITPVVRPILIMMFPPMLCICDDKIDEAKK